MQRGPRAHLHIGRTGHPQDTRQPGLRYPRDSVAAARKPRRDSCDPGPRRALRTAASTNLQATQMALSRMLRLPRACGACKARAQLCSRKQNGPMAHWHSAGARALICCSARMYIESVTGSVRSSGTGLLCAGCMAACVQARSSQSSTFCPKPNNTQQAAVLLTGASLYSFSSRCLVQIAEGRPQIEDCPLNTLARALSPRQVSRQETAGRPGGAGCV